MTTTFIIFLVTIFVTESYGHETPSPSPLPSGFLGAWRSNPEYAVIGPGFGLTLSIHPLTFKASEGMENSTGWYMEQLFVDGSPIDQSIQQFWVSGSDLVYCGHLLNFFKALNTFDPSQPLSGYIRFPMRLQQQSDVMISWSSDDAPMSWTLQLSEDKSTLLSTAQLPDTAGVIHLRANFTRIESDPVTALITHTSIHGQGVVLQGLPPPCNLTIQGSGAKGRACPFHRRIKEMEGSAPRRPRSSPPLSYCAVLNRYHNVTLRFTNNTEEQTVDVTLSAQPQDGMRLDQTYLALGIMPAWPGMTGMDIVLGYQGPGGSSCVRSMYAQQYIGTPVDNPSQVISKTSVTIEVQTNTLTVAFTRPWSTGAWDLSKGPLFPSPEQGGGYPIVAFALGRAGSTCSEAPQYHGGARGVHGFYWPDPLQALPESMYC